MSRVTLQQCARRALSWASIACFLGASLAGTLARAQSAESAKPPSPLPAVPPASPQTGQVSSATPPPPPPPPSPFQFTLKGTVAGTVFMQDAPFVTGSGSGALLGPIATPVDSSFFGGDIRQSRVSFIVRGPQIWDATPSGTLELEMAGGNQITSVPAGAAPIIVRDTTGMVVGTASSPVTTSAQGDESLLPRVRTAFVEMNWNMGENVLRVGQYHNLLLAMVSASAAHPATLGYGGGQLGWRSPGITYSHRFMLGAETSLDAAVQISRNSWVDNVSLCSPGASPPLVHCLPSGVSLGEAGLPQFEARLLLASGREESPFPHYAPTVWQAHIVGHWDQKDLSGIGNVATAPAGMVPPRDTMNTWAIEAGGKVKLGPVLIATNGWYGQNTGNVYGQLFQMAAPDRPDVLGFGVWGQLGLSLTKNFSLWVFGGIDRPNRDQAIAAGFTRLQNVQLAAMLAYVEGPIIISLEWFRATTTTLVAGTPATDTMPAVPPTEVSTSGNQPSLTLAYSF